MIRSLLLIAIAGIIPYSPVPTERPHTQEKQNEKQQAHQQNPKPAQKGQRVCGVGREPQPKPRILVPFKKREFVPPETIGLPKDFPGRVMKTKMVFQCECCGVTMHTHVYHPHLPECPKDGCYMHEREK